MKKFSLLLGALGGAMAGYLLSNDKLRDALIKAKDAESAARTLGKHLQRDGRKLAREVQSFVESDDVRRNLGTFKTFARLKADEAKQQIQTFFEHGVEKTSKASRSGAKAVKIAVKRAKGKARVAATKAFRREEI